MHVSSTILLTSLLAVFSFIDAAAPSCLIPSSIVVETFGKPFTLTAIAPKSTWFVLLPTPSAIQETQPYISHAKIAAPVFHLTDGNLTTTGAEGKTYSARLGPTVAGLQPILFGEVHTRFIATLTCDNQNDVYYELITQGAFVVEKVAEGQKIFGKTSQGTGVRLSLKINQ